MKITKIIIASLLLALVSAPAFAARNRMSYDNYNSNQQPNVYIGLSGGKTSTDIPNISTTATAYSVFAGYSFNRFVSTEIAYTNLGNLDLGSPDTLKMTAASLSLVGYIPMGQTVSLFGKAGYASTSAQAEIGGVLGTVYTQSGATLGAGLQFNIKNNMNIRLAYDNYKITDGTTIYNANMPNLAVMFRF